MDNIGKIKADYENGEITEDEALTKITEIGYLKRNEAYYLVMGWKVKPTPKSQIYINRLMANRYEIIEKLDSIDKKKKAYDALEQTLLETSIL